MGKQGVEITKGWERICGIYFIKVFNYIYVGKSINIKKRLREHVYRKNQAIDHLICKFPNHVKI